MEKRVPLRTKLPENLVIEMKILAAKRRVPIYEIYEEAVSEYLLEKQQDN